jgi:hypothetical protein
MADREIWGMREADQHSPSNLVVTGRLERSAAGWPGGILAVTYTDLNTGYQDEQSIVIDDLQPLVDAILAWKARS